MRKPTQESEQKGNNEEMTTEIIELTCQEVESLTRAFEMISELCEQLQNDVVNEYLLDIPEQDIN
jgi:hypothetical protein